MKIPQVQDCPLKFRAEDGKLDVYLVEVKVHERGAFGRSLDAIKGSLESENENDDPGEKVATPGSG